MGSIVERGMGRGWMSERGRGSWVDEWVDKKMRKAKEELDAAQLIELA